MKSKRLAERKLKKQIEQTYAGGFPHFEGGFYVATQLKNGYLYDKENRKILDCDNRDGSVLFDRQEKQFSKALKNMFKSGIPFSSPSHLEIEYGHEISKHLHYHDRLRLTETRNDALRLCARLACAYTERSTVIFFGDAPPARSMKDTWIPMSASNLPDAVRLLQQSENKIAAVIINPLLTDDHDILEGSENLKDFVGNIVADGALLVIDEHYTGFRLSSRGFAGRYYLQPDLTVYSGIACGGLPGGILAAGKDIMDFLSEREELHDDLKDMHTLAMVYGLATIRCYDSLNVQGHFVKLGTILLNQIQNELLPALKNSNVEIQLTPLQTLLKITFLSELHTVKKLSKELHKSMLKRGYYLPPVRNPVISFNFATSENDIGNFSRALLKSLQNI